MHVSELLDQEPAPVRAWSTGLGELDRLTGGFVAGDLWVITGAPGIGRTTLLTQFVYWLSTEHDFEVAFHTARTDSIDAVRRRLLALTCRHPRTLDSGAVALDRLSVPQSDALSLLRESQLSVYLGGGWWIGPETPVDEPTCLAIDEPELNRPPVLGREGLDALRRFADRSGVVLVTAPGSHCIESSVPIQRLREDWASVADIMIEIDPVNESGSASLRVIRNRRGPLGAVRTIHEPHLAHFVPE